jgi:hypothetical protein
MTRRTLAPPVGFIALSEHIETSTHFYVRAFVPPRRDYYALLLTGSAPYGAPSIVSHSSPGRTVPCVTSVCSPSLLPERALQGSS